MAAIIVTTIQLAFQFPYFIELYEKIITAIKDMTS